MKKEPLKLLLIVLAVLLCIPGYVTAADRNEITDYPDYKKTEKAFTGQILDSVKELQTEESVMILWTDKENQKGKRPDQIMITLSNGTEVILDAGNFWTATITGLPKYTNGSEIVYSWSKDIVPEGYILSGISKVGKVTTYSLELTQLKAEELARSILDKIGWDLKSAYQWSVDMKYEEVYTGISVYASAYYGFKNNSGDCFAKACTFCVMARVLGYDCIVIYGSVPYANGDYGDHAWCEIQYKDDIKICDPEFESDALMNGFLIDYGQKGTWQYVYGGIVPD